MKTILSIFGGIFLLILVIDSLIIVAIWLSGLLADRKRKRQEQEIRVRLHEDAEEEVIR